MLTILSSLRSAPRLTFAFASTSLLSIAVTWLYAHEGHVALPSRGAQVDAVKGLIVLSRESRDALAVKAVEISTKPIPSSVSAYATIVAPWQKHAFVSSRLSGRVVALHVQPGQNVTVGQTLADVASAELENLQLEILAAQSELRLAERVLSLLRDSSGSVTGQTILDSDNKRLQAANAIIVGRAKWRGLGLDDADFDALLLDSGHRVATYPVRSPLGGTVIHADLAAGRIIEPGEHLFEVVDLSTVWAQIGVLESALNNVKIGQKVDLRFVSQPDEVFPSVIQAIGTALDPQTHVVSVWAELINPPGREPRLLPGMNGQARIILDRPADARVVPSTALVDDGLAQYLLVEEARAEKQSEYRRKNVVVVRQTANQVEVRSSGLFPGDRVVTQGAHELGGFFVPSVLKLSPEATQTIGLQVETVSRHVVSDVVIVDGQVDALPGQRGTASTLLAGNIVRILVDRGQAVKAGQVLAEVFSLELKSLQLELIREQLALDLLEQQSQAYRSAGDAVPWRKRIDLDAELNSARFRRDSLRNRLQLVGLTKEQVNGMVAARRPIDAVPVCAPIAGVIARFDKILGQSVKAEESVFAIHNLSRPTVQAFVSERDARHVGVNQSARVRLVTDPGADIAARVVRSSQVVTADDQTLRIWVELDAASNVPLRDGQLASVAVITSAGAVVLAAPNSAVLRDGTRSYVFVKKADGSFERRTIVTGRADDQRTEIIGGLTEGEIIAIRGVNGLQTAYASIR